MLNPIVLSVLFLMVIGVCGILFVWANWNVNDINGRINYHLREQSYLIHRLQHAEDQIKTMGDLLDEGSGKVREMDDSRKAFWDALIELEAKVKASAVEILDLVDDGKQLEELENGRLRLVNQADEFGKRILALERKAEDSTRMYAGNGVNRMRAMISEQGGVKDGILPIGVVR